MEIFKLFGSILIKDEDALKKLDEVDKKGAKTGKTFDKMAKDIGEGVKDTGKKLMGIGLAVTTTLAGFVKVGSEWSAQVAGQQFLFNNLDKSVQNMIESNSKNAKAIGLTNQQYKNGATDISVYYKNMGLTAEKTSELSGKTMDLVADLGAVKDVPFDEALGDFKSALMGNYEAVDKYGISLSASTIENSEFVKSLGKSWNQLSDNEKMMAAYNEITRQGASAQGLARQEAEQFGMQLKYWKQRIFEVSGAIGEQLLPVLEPLLNKLVQGTEKVGKWVEDNPKLTQTILIVAGAFGVFTTVLGAILIPLGGLIVLVGTFNVAMLPTYGIILGIVAGVGILIAAGVALYANWDNLKAGGQELWSSIENAFTNMKNGATNKINETKNNVSNALSNMKSDVSNKINDTKNAALNKFDEIKSGITNRINQAKDNVKNGIDRMKALFDFSWSLPKLKLPRIDVKGKFGLNPPSVPKFDIAWYKDGGIMMNPTMFGFNPLSNKAMVGGEAGPEAILPIEKLKEWMEEWRGNGSTVVINIDGREFMRAIAPYKSELDDYDARNPKFSY